MTIKSPTLLLAFMVTLGVGGCRTSTAIRSPGSLTQDDWNAYYAVAMQAFNDPAVWRVHGGERPMEFILHPSLEPWGSRLGELLEIESAKPVPSENLVSVHVPVESIGKLDHGVPHVIIEFRHPSREIVDIYVTHIVF